MKKIGILGSTGSIGTQTLEIVRSNGDLQVTALAAGSNVREMERQIREFSPLYAVMWAPESADELKKKVADTGTKVLQGMDGLLKIAVMEQMDVLVTAIVGMIGIRPTIAAIQAGKTTTLADVIMTMYENNFTLEQIAVATKKSVEEVSAIIKKREPVLA